jgi:hypothetical protein
LPATRCWRPTNAFTRLDRDSEAKRLPLGDRPSPRSDVPVRLGEIALVGAGFDLAQGAIPVGRQQHPLLQQRLEAKAQRGVVDGHLLHLQDQAG